MQIFLTRPRSQRESLNGEPLPADAGTLQLPKGTTEECARDLFAALVVGLPDWGVELVDTGERLATQEPSGTTAVGSFKERL